MAYLFPDTDRREAHLGQLNAIMSAHERELDENATKPKVRTTLAKANGTSCAAAKQ